MLGFVSGLLKKVTSGATQRANQSVNRNFMEAVVGVMVLMGHTDGDFGTAEQEKLAKVVAVLPELKSFGHLIQETIDLYTGYFEVSYDLGKKRIMQEIADIRAEPNQKEDILALAVTAAKADGNISDSEQKLIVEIGKVLGLKVNA